MSRRRVDFELVTECFTETELALALGYEGKVIKHPRPAGKSRVIHHVKQKPDSSICIGLIDLDGNRTTIPGFLPVFNDTRVQLSVLTSQDRPDRHLLGFEYDFETWILRECAKTGLDPARYQLPSEKSRWADLKKKGLDGKGHRLAKLIADLSGISTSGVVTYQNKLNELLRT